MNGASAPRMNKAAMTPAGHRANRRVAFLEIARACWSERVVFPRASGSSRHGRPNAPDHQAPFGEPSQCGVDRSRRDDAAGPLFDVRANRPTIRIAAERRYREEDQLLEFTEMSHASCRTKIKPQSGLISTRQLWEGPAT